MACAALLLLQSATSNTLSQPTHTKKTIIGVSTLFDGKGHVLHDTRIVVEDSKIVAIDPKAEPVDYDLRGKTVMPGWIDAHVHLTWIFGKEGKNAGQGGTTPEAIYAAASNAYVTLMAGFTTVQSVGSTADIPLRDAIASGVVVCVPAGNGNKDAGLDLNGNSFCETNSILVGATLFDDDPAVNRKSPLSNWGDRVVVSAPGEETNDVTCGSNTDDELVNEFGRTSGATPKVAGTAALMLEANPNLTHAEIRSILACTGTPVADTGSTPVGTFLNAYGAVCQAQVHNN